MSNPTVSISFRVVNPPDTLGAELKTLHDALRAQGATVEIAEVSNGTVTVVSQGFLAAPDALFITGVREAMNS
jgi:hypothetical protein